MRKEEEESTAEFASHCESMATDNIVVAGAPFNNNSKILPHI